MNKIKSFILLSLLVLNISSANAAIGAATAIFNPVVGGKIALTGLATFGGSVILEGLSDAFGDESGVFMFAGLLVGVIMLDEQSGQIKFSAISEENREKLGLSKSEVEIYHSELEEANLVFEDISSLSSDEADAKQRWQEASEFLSEETLSVMVKLISK